LWLILLVIVGLWFVLDGGKQVIEDKSKLAAKPQLEGLQFLDANHPSIRVRYSIHLRSNLD
jgi:hypothetical protein